jgi:hypothetical protein
MQIKYNKFLKVDDKLTFGYKWIKIDSDNRMLFIGKSGKGSCIDITYNKDEQIAFKGNSGYYRSCNEENNLPQGQEGTYKMIYASIYTVIDRYPDAKLLSWQDNTMITLDKNHDVSLSDSDTILYGRPRIISIIGESAIYDKIAIDMSEIMLTKIKRIQMISPQVFIHKYYDTFFENNHLDKLQNIYYKSENLIRFFKLGDKYLTKHGLKKAIFIPINRIFKDYGITSYIGVVWTLDIQAAYRSIQDTIHIEKIQNSEQIGGGHDNLDNIEVPKVKLLRNTGRGGDVMLIGASPFFLKPLRKYR